MHQLPTPVRPSTLIGKQVVANLWSLPQQMTILDVDPDGIMCQSNVQPLIIWLRASDLTLGVTLVKFPR